MTNLSQNLASLKSKFRLAAIILILVVVAFPFFTLSSHHNDLFVDHDASGTQDGSRKHPFRTIDDAMDKASSGTEIHVSHGEYKENVKIKEGVSLSGSNKEKTIIKADNDDKDTVIMKNKSKIFGFTIRDGRNGIKVEEDAKVTITSCIIKDNDRDGINLEKADVRDSREATISESKIEDNGKAGIFSERRKLNITENEIKRNDSDGVDILGGSNAWINNNTIRENRGSGMKLVIDRSSIWAKRNLIRENKREGIEMSFSGDRGRVNIDKSKIVENGQYGIARIQRCNFANSFGLWNERLTFNLSSSIWGNRFGQISSVIFQ